jgi:lysophospholipase L1-like esterase
MFGGLRRGVRLIERPGFVGFNRFATGYVLVAILLLAGCGEDTRLSPIAPGSTILSFGDSLTFGTGATPEASYPAVLGRLAGRDIVNAGIPGEVSARGLQRLPELLEQHTPALVILCHGGNDILRKLERAEMRRNLLAMINLIRAAGAEVLVLGVPRPGLLLSDDQTYREIAAETGTVYLADVFSDILDDNRLKADAIHPNAAGYEQVAQRIHELMLEQGVL